MYKMYMWVYKVMIKWNKHSVGVAVYISDFIWEKEVERKRQKRQTERDTDRQTLSSNCFMKVEMIHLNKVPVILGA